MIRNNLSSVKCTIPGIKIEPFEDWKNTASIYFEKNFSITDLFLTIKSYSDSHIIIPIQILVLVKDVEEKGRSFFSSSIASKKISSMDLKDFSNWYESVWEKDAVYMGNELFEHAIILKYTSFVETLLYPIYPWKEDILNETLAIKDMEDIEKNLEITDLKNKIKLLEEKISEYEKEKKK